MRFLILFFYSFFATTITSTSFGTAVSISISYCLFFTSVIVVVKNWKNFKLNSTEIMGFSIVGWLFFICIAKSNSWDGFFFILNEYRMLWFAPIIGVAISLTLRKEQIWIPLIVGSFFNFLGSLFIFLSNGAKVFWLVEFLPQVGLRAGGVGSNFSLGGKFVQGWLVTIWSAFFFAQPIWRGGLKQFALGLILILSIGFMIIHAVVLADSRSSFFGVTFVFLSLMLLFAALAKRDHRKLTILILIFGIVMIASLGAPLVPERISYGVSNAVNYFQNGSVYTSIGLRLEVWREVLSLDASTLVFGVGAGNWKDLMGNLFPIGHPAREFYIWNDFHSQFLWLIVKGGLVALVLYLCFVASIFLTSVKLIETRRFSGAGLLGIGLCGVLLVMGSLNSVFTALRESHITGLALMVWFALVRLEENVSR